MSRCTHSIEIWEHAAGDNHHRCSECDLRLVPEGERLEAVQAWTEVDRLRGALRYIAGFDVAGYEGHMPAQDVARKVLGDDL